MGGRRKPEDRRVDPWQRDIDLDSHRYEAHLEDAEFLFGHGVTFADAAARIGVTTSSLAKLFERRKDRDVAAGKSYTYFGAREGEETGGWPLSAMRRPGPGMGPSPTPGRGPAHELSVQRCAPVRYVSSVVSRPPKGRNLRGADDRGGRHEGAA